MKEQIVYVPNVYIPSIYELLSASYLIISNPNFIQVYAKKGLAYYTSQGATAHAQTWLDMQAQKWKSTANANKYSSIYKAGTA